MVPNYLINIKTNDSDGMKPALSLPVRPLNPPVPALKVRPFRLYAYIRQLCSNRM